VRGAPGKRRLLLRVEFERLMMVVGVERGEWTWPGRWNGSEWNGAGGMEMTGPAGLRTAPNADRFQRKNGRFYE